MTDDDKARWAALAAPIPPERIAWRQDGKVKGRGDGTFAARFVCYVEAGTVRERLDSVFPGEWWLSVEPLPQVTTADADGVDNTGIAMRARLTVGNVSREDVGQGKDYKSASTDAFKRAAVRFGIAHELYDMELNWVPVDGDGKYPKPLVDPQEHYERRHAKPAAPQAAASAAPKSNGTVPKPGKVQDAEPAKESSENPPATEPDPHPCPVCGGRMWDNRLTKRNPRAPDFKCRDRNCDGVIWPSKKADPKQQDLLDEEEPAGASAVRTEAGPGLDDDGLPF